MSTTNDAAGLTVIDGLVDGNYQDGDGPRIDKLAAVSGATVVRISFAQGQLMQDHRSAAPILVQGTVGEVEFTVAGTTVSLVPGTAVHVEAGVQHRLIAKQDSVLILTILR